MRKEPMAFILSVAAPTDGTKRIHTKVNKGLLQFVPSSTQAEIVVAAH